MFRDPLAEMALRLGEQLGQIQRLLERVVRAVDEVTDDGQRVCPGKDHSDVAARVSLLEFLEHL